MHFYAGLTMVNILQAVGTVCPMRTIGQAVVREEDPIPRKGVCPSQL